MRVRAPSIIVYTPTGHVAVHFVPEGRKRFVADGRSVRRLARRVMGYVSCFGPYGLYAGGWLHHYLLVNLGPANAGNTLRRVLSLSEPATLSFPPARLTVSRFEIA
jgi:lipocalin-like protein